MKYLLSPLFIFSVCLLGYVVRFVNNGQHDGTIILVPLLFICSLYGFTAHHLIFGLNIRLPKAIMLELAMIVLLFMAGIYMGMNR